MTHPKFDAFVTAFILLGLKQFPGFFDSLIVIQAGKLFDRSDVPFRKKSNAQRLLHFEQPKARISPKMHATVRVLYCWAYHVETWRNAIPFVWFRPSSVMTQEAPSAFSEYRLFHLKENGEEERSEPFLARDDAEAMHRAWSKMDQAAIEIWIGTRLVGRIDPPKSE